MHQSQYPLEHIYLFIYFSVSNILTMGIFGDNLPRIAASPLFSSNLHVKESQMTITSTEMNFKLIALLLSFALIFPTVWTNNSYAQFYSLEQEMIGNHHHQHHRLQIKD